MSEPKTVTLANSYPHTFVVDPDDETGEVQTILLRIARFTVEQGKAFNARWAAVMFWPSARQIFRKPDADEQARTMRPVGPAGKEIETFLVDDDEIRRRRLREMTDDDRAAFEQQEVAEWTAEYDFLVDTITKYVRVASGQRVLFDREDGEPPVVVKTGADLVLMFGGHLPALRRLGNAVRSENNLSGVEKNVWRSLSDSRRTSNPPATDGGGTPGATVTPVEPAASAATAAAMDASAMSPSGSTGN